MCGWGSGIDLDQLGRLASLSMTPGVLTCGDTEKLPDVRVGRVEDGRGSLGPMANAPFPIPAHQTGRADFRHPAFRPASPCGPRQATHLCRCRAMTPWAGNPSSPNDTAFTDGPGS